MGQCNRFLLEIKHRDPTEYTVEFKVLQSLYHKKHRKYESVSDVLLLSYVCNCTANVRGNLRLRDRKFLVLPLGEEEVQRAGKRNAERRKAVTEDKSVEAHVKDDAE